ncbi:MAG: hypothetical protein C5B60_03840 [Chloroflexi bacterium]|nr:MAG: hypothetical protein C5B60_03840 [Chloroflexota bacterium]
MCVATVAVVGATVATTAGGVYAASQASQQTAQAQRAAANPQEKQLQGYPPTRGLISYSARLLAENATATRPTLRDWATSGETAKFPITDTGFTPAEAADLGLVDPHTGMPEPFVNRSQQQLTPAQQVFLGQARARQGATGPLARYGQLTAKEERLRARMGGAGVAQSSVLAGRLTRLQGRISNLQTKLKTGG